MGGVEGRVASGLTVSLHDAAEVAAPPGWATFVTAQRLPAVWDWSVVHAAATGHRSAVLAATVHDGPTMCGLATARFIGARFGRGAIPMAGVVDVDCLVSSALPGIVLADGTDCELATEVVAALRDAFRQAYGRRVWALLFRQVPADLLPAVLRWPAIVREGGPIAVFHNRFTDFDGYLATLRRKRRSSLRTVMRSVEEDADLVVAFTGRGDPAGPLDVDGMRALQSQVANRHHQRWYVRKRLILPPVARVVLASPGVHRLSYHDRAGRLLGYGTTWDHPERPILGNWGALHHAAGGRKYLWFHFMASQIRWCIESGRHGLISGQGSIADKLDLGYDLSRQWAVLVPLRHGRTRA